MKSYKKEPYRLKFDTSSANLECFINQRHKIYSQHHTKTNNNPSIKPIQFHPQPFLTSVLTHGLAKDFACQTQIQQLVSNKINDLDQNTKEEPKDNINYNDRNNTPSKDFKHWLPSYSPKHQLNTRVATESTKTDPSQSTPQSNNEEEQIYLYTYHNQYYQLPKRRNISEEQNQYLINLQTVQYDGRTTLMIRNIPNKYTQDMLVEQLNVNHRYKYNFVYLPIDYNNNCNVGYAFVNFIHTKFIEDFYNEFNGRKWNKFNSQKICSLAYARIQGTASLINHFQNSNMIKDKKIKPIIGEETLTSIWKIVEGQKQYQYQKF